MNKPKAVIDKCLLQPICAFQDEARSKHYLRFLTERFTIYAPPMLIEEVSANYYSPQAGISKDLAAKMLAAISDFHWMEHPLELLYEEIVLKRDIGTGFDLNPAMEEKYRSWIGDLEAHLPELEELFCRRAEYKKTKRELKKRFQERFKDPTHPDALNFPDLAAFVQNGRLFLQAMFVEPRLKGADFFKYLAKRLKEWHPESVANIEKAITELNLASLGSTPFMHDVTLAYLLYLSGPVARLGPKESIKANPLVLSGNQINNDEDEEYVTSAVLCDYLLTCDKGMHRMAELLNTACLFKHSGCKRSRAVLIHKPLDDQLEHLLERECLY